MIARIGRGEQNAALTVSFWAWYNRKAMNSIVVLFKPSQRRGMRTRKPPSDALFLCVVDAAT